LVGLVFAFVPGDHHYLRFAGSFYGTTTTTNTATSHSSYYNLPKKPQPFRPFFNIQRNQPK